LKRLTEVQTESTHSVHHTSFHFDWSFIIKYISWLGVIILADGFIFFGGGFLEVLEEREYLIWRSRRIPCWISCLNYCFGLLP